MAQHLYSTSSCQKGTPNTHIWPHLVRKAHHSHPTSSCQKGSTLTFDPLLSERHSTHIWPCVNTSHQNGSALISDLILSKRLCTYIRPCSKTPYRKGSALIVDHAWKHRIEKAQHLHSTMLERTASKGLYTYIQPCSKAPHRKGMHSHLIMEEIIPPSHQNGPHSQTELPGNWPCASILPKNGSCHYIWPTHQNGQHSHLTWKEPNPLPMIEWFSSYIWSSGNTSLSHIRMDSHS